ncbi:hypothetical protein V6259_15840 [Marinomonas sp. TI.3.20]|uniref:hypothetical protein n=1 Tax=Marinomonas sp. TI.3.20 TaxID=3121296 RepID=UPI00311D8818
MNTVFKSELERAYDIVQWTPTEEQLLKIAKFIKEHPEQLRLVSGYISEVCTDVLFYAAEGYDNSDLNYLIAVAIKAVEEAN